jgi:bile acid:Na+ symporter, BASS family
VTVLAPLAAGIAVHSVAPAFADRIAGPVSLVATIMLVAAIVPVLFTQFPAIGSLIGNGTIVGLAVFVVGGLAVGHLLGGPDPEDRTVLALSTASRHPGVAVAIAQANFPEQKLALAAVLLYMLVSGVVLIPYMIWTRRRRAAAARAV